MVGKSQIKLIKRLHQKKYRNQHRLFVVEGIKAVQELLDSNIEPYKIYCVSTGLLEKPKDGIELISETDLKKMSALKNQWILALNDIRDPGNLGTIIRLCDWFGIEHLVCSEHTIDCYNPKVLQATMGSISRVNIVYTDLVEFLKRTTLPVYGTFMDGESVYSSKISD